MKKRILSSLLIIAMIITSLVWNDIPVRAADIISGNIGVKNGITWIYDKSSKTLTITGEDTIDEEYEYSPFFTWCSGAEKAVFKDCTISGSAEALFCCMENLISIECDNLDTSGVTNMLCMFGVCTNLKSIDLSEFNTSNVTNMGGMFANCENLESADVSGFDTSNVIDMGNMFGNCGSLKNLDVSNFDTSNVTDMACMFSNCYSLSNIDVSNFDTSNVTDMNFMFSACYSLSNIDVSNFNTSKVTNMRGLFCQCRNLERVDVSNFDTSNVTDMACMFVNCNSLSGINLDNFDTSNVTDIQVMFCLCSGLTSVDVSNFDTSNVEYMDRIFEGCTSLKNVDISGFDTRNVTDNMSEILKDCTGLESICTPKYMNEGQYIDLPCTFYDSQMNSVTSLSSENCNMFLKKDRTGIENETEVSKDSYLIKIVDGSGTPIYGAKVNYDDQTGITGSNGQVVFDLFTIGVPVITVSKEGYITWTNENSNYDKKEAKSETIIIYKESEGDLKLKSAYYDNTNLLTETKTLNLKNTENLVGDLTDGDFSILCEALNSSEVKEYQLWQKDVKISTSQDGLFELNVDQGFVKGGNCFVRVISKNGQEVDTNINLTFVANVINKNNSIALMDDAITVKVDDDIPFLGGSKVKLAFPDLPLDYNVSDEKIYIGFNSNVFDSSDNGSSDIEKIKKKINTAKKAGNTALGKKTQEEIKKLIKENKEFDLPGGKFQVDIVGYAEADFGSTTASGEIYVCISATTPTWGFNTWVSVVPVTVQIKGSIEAQIGSKISYNLEKGTLDGGLNIEITVDVNAFGGVGIGQAIGVGVYGDAKVKTDICFFEADSGVQSVDLTGQLGIKAYLGIFSYERAFAYNTWHLYTANNVATDDDSSDENSLNGLFDSENYAIESLDYLKAESEWNGYATSLNDVEVGMDLISLVENTYRNAQPVMVSDGEVAYAAFLRADADTGEVYVACTKMQDGTWSDPVRADNTSILDDAPQLLIDKKGNVWIAYAKTSENADITNLQSYAENQSIVVGIINTETLEFTKVKEFESNGYAHMQQIALVNGVPTLTWMESTITDENSVLSSNNNTVIVAKYENETWSEGESVCEINHPVSQICLGDTGIACSVDTDDSFITTEDRTLVCYDWQGNETNSITGVTGKISYDILPGEKEASFIWNGSDELCSLDSYIDVTGITNEYCVLDDCIYYSTSDGSGAELAVIRMNSDGSFSEPVLLTNMDRYLENLSVETINNIDVILAMQTESEIKEESVISEKDLVWSIVQPIHDIRIDSVDYDDEIVTPGESVTVTMSITNVGEQEVDSVNIFIDGNKISTENIDLQNGQSKEISIELECPEKLTEYAIQVTDYDGDLTSDNTPNNNSIKIKLGYTDLSIEANLQKIGENRAIIAEVNNHGTESASGKVTLYDEDGQLLNVSLFSNLERDDTLLIEIPISSSVEGTTLNAIVIAEQEELFEHDNLDTVYIFEEDDWIGIEVSDISLNKTQANLKIGSSLQLTATVMPSNALNKKINWNSSDTSVATVDSTGKVIAVSEGTATITAKAEDGSGVYDTCTVCVEAKATHIWDTEYTIDKAATCTETGSKSIHCNHCDETKDSQIIPATGHTLVTDSAVAATYTSTGKTEGSHCSECGEILKKQETIPALKGLAPAQNGTRTYYENGKVKTSLTTLMKDSGTWYYVEKGVVSGKYTGLVKYNGSWFYVKNSKVDFSYTGLCKYNGSWYYVEKGVLNWNYTGLCKFGSSWYYVQKGVLNWNYTGLCKYGSTWYYVQKGVLNWNYTGLCKYGSSWYYVQKGVLNWNYTGLCKYGTKWYYVQKGVLNWNYTGLCKYGSSWYYVQKGVLNWNYTGLCKYGSSWYYVKNGVLNWNYTGLCKYGTKWYYVQKGVVNFKYTGYTNYGGSRWYVKNGVMVKKA